MSPPSLALVLPLPLQPSSLWSDLVIDCSYRTYHWFCCLDRLHMMNPHNEGYYQHLYLNHLWFCHAILFWEGVGWDWMGLR